MKETLLDNSKIINCCLYGAHFLVKNKSLSINVCVFLYKEKIKD